MADATGIGAKATLLKDLFLTGIIFARFRPQLSYKDALKLLANYSFDLERLGRQTCITRRYSHHGTVGVFQMGIMSTHAMYLESLEHTAKENQLWALVGRPRSDGSMQKWIVPWCDIDDLQARLEKDLVDVSHVEAGGNSDTQRRVASMNIEYKEMLSLLDLTEVSYVLDYAEIMAGLSPHERNTLANARNLESILSCLDYETKSMKQTSREILSILNEIVNACRMVTFESSFNDFVGELKTKADQLGKWGGEYEKKLNQFSSMENPDTNPSIVQVKRKLDGIKADHKMRSVSLGVGQILKETDKPRNASKDWDSDSMMGSFTTSRNAVLETKNMLRVVLDALEHDDTKLVTIEVSEHKLTTVAFNLQSAFEEAFPDAPRFPAEIFSSDKLELPDEWKLLERWLPPLRSAVERIPAIDEDEDIELQTLVRILEATSGNNDVGNVPESELVSALSEVLRSSGLVPSQAEKGRKYIEMRAELPQEIPFLTTPFTGGFLARWVTRRSRVLRTDIRDMSKKMKSLGIRHGVLIHLSLENAEERDEAEIASDVLKTHIRRLTRQELGLFPTNPRAWHLLVPFGPHSRLESQETRLLREIFGIFNCFMESAVNPPLGHRELVRQVTSILRDLSRDARREHEGPHDYFPGIHTAVKSELKELRDGCSQIKDRGWDLEVIEKALETAKQLNKKLNNDADDEEDTAGNQLLHELGSAVCCLLMNSARVHIGIRVNISYYLKRVWRLIARDTYKASILQSGLVLILAYSCVMILVLFLGPIWLAENSPIVTFTALLFAFLAGLRKGKMARESQ
ncbi:MAG: hypothetical protein ACFFER_18450 [Candidatus Thorarchaeota archaeon]